MDNQTTIIALSFMLIFLVGFVIFQTLAFIEFKRKIFAKFDEVNNRVNGLNDLVAKDFKNILNELKKFSA